MKLIENKKKNSFIFLKINLFIKKAIIFLIEQGKLFSLLTIILFKSCFILLKKELKIISFK